MTSNWQAPNWQNQVEAWITAQLQAHGRNINGALEQPHIRPWATVLRVPTTDGTFFFKATTAALAHEPALTAALSRWRPGCMPQVLASDAPRGWLLMHDAGIPLRTFVQAEQSHQRWLDLLPRYAEVQIELADRVAQLLDIGVPDRRLATLPTLYDTLLDNHAALMIDQPDGLTGAEIEALQTMRPRVQAMCEALMAYGVPETLHHDDFHDANIFVQEGRVTFADWAESCIAHPFFTLVVMLRSTAYQLKWHEDSPELAYLRDAYLEPFTRFDTRANLIAASKISHRLGMICRTLTWHHVVSHLEEPHKSDYAEAVPGWLQEFLAGKLTSAE